MHAPSFDSASQNAAQAMVVVDVRPDTTFQICDLNDAYEQRVELERQDLIGEPLDVLASHLGRAALDTAYTKYMQCCDTQGPTQYDMRVRTDHGATWWRVCLSPVLRSQADGNLHVSHIVETSTKISPMQRMSNGEPQRHDTPGITSQRTQAASRDPNEFLASISHKLRTPLSGLLGFVELLLESDLSAEQSYFAETIEKSGRRLQTLIHNILDLSKLEVGDIELEPVVFDVPGVLEDVVAFLRPIASTNDLNLAYVVSDDVTDVMVGDRDWVFQLLLNLVSNAIKCTEGGSVVVRVEQSEDGILFCIQDTGPGISEEKHDGRLRPLEREKGSWVASQTKGVDLAIAQQLVCLMNGEIWFESTHGEGTTFFVTIPLQFASDVPFLGASRTRQTQNQRNACLTPPMHATDDRQGRPAMRTNGK